MCTPYDLHRALHLLDPVAYAMALAAMDRAGALALHLQALPPALRVAFLDQCVEQGFVTEIPPLGPSAAIACPPAAPRLLVNRRGLPRCVRLLVHEENVARTNRYGDEYRAYLARFGALVERAKSTAELRALGEPAVLFVPATEPGLDFDGDDDLVWDFDRRVRVTVEDDVTQAVHRKTFQFRAHDSALSSLW